MSSQSPVKPSAAGQAALASRFETEEQLRAHMRTIGERGNAGRLTLSADEREALGAAYRLLDRIYQRHEAKLSEGSEGNDG